MESPEYHQFGSSDDGTREQIIIPQRGIRRKLFYVIYGIPVLLLLSLLLATGIKFGQVNREIADIRLRLETINTKISPRTTAGEPVHDVLLEAIVPVRGSCGEGWVFFQNSCYLLSTKMATWSSAEAECKTLGAHLVVLNNVEEVDYISKINDIAQHYWIGLVEREHEGVWTWVDGTDYKTTPTFWDEDQPDNWDFRVNGEDCGQLHPSFQRKRNLWNDADCSLKYRYICEAVRPGHRTR